MEGTAVIYARVSTSKQAEKGISLDAQVTRCTAYCEANGLTIQDTVIDTVSAKDIENRPGMKRVLAMIERRQARHVVTLRLDRLHRDTVNALQTVHLMGKRGVELHVVDEHTSVNTGSADDEFLFTLKAGLATRERKLIGERTRLALARKREKGEFTGGEPVYGFRVVEGKLIPDADEQRVIKKIRRLRKKGYSIRRIAVTLTADGHLNRRGRPFGKTQVERILKQAA